MGNDLKPITREEQFLDAMIDGDISDMPVPITRRELFWSEIAKNIGTNGDLSAYATKEDLKLKAEKVHEHTEYLKSLPNHRHNASEIDNIQATQVNCTDTHGVNKATVSEYINYLCGEVKELRTLLEALTPPTK